MAWLYDSCILLRDMVSNVKRPYWKFERKNSKLYAMPFDGFFWLRKIDFPHWEINLLLSSIVLEVRLKASIIGASGQLFNAKRKTRFWSPK